MALLVGGCGGGDSETTPHAAESRSTAAGNNGGTNPESGKRATGQTGKPHKPQGISPTDSSALPNQGSKEVAPGVPTVKQGDNSIQEYGVESEGSERVEAALVLKDYLDAQLAGEWARACSLLVAETREGAIELASQAAQGRGGQIDCPEAMKGFFQEVPRGPLRALSELHVLSMRVEGDRGFLIYDDGTGRASESPMQREDGKWKVRGLLAKELLVKPVRAE